MTIEERRATGAKVAARDGGKVGGYALKWSRYSRNLGGFVEQVARDAFASSEASGYPGVMARWNHDDMALLGTTDAGTLRLTSDDVGLDYDIDLPDTSIARDFAQLVARGDVKKSSFAFYTVEDEWSLTDQDYPLRTITSAKLVDVAPVNDPAYLDTTAGVRVFDGLAELRGVPADEVAQLAVGNRLRDLIRSAPVVIDFASAIDHDLRRRTWEWRLGRPAA